jgi:hypothetical protein
MRRLTLTTLPILALVAVGCGGVGTGVDMLPPPPDLAGAHFQSGTYTLSNVMNKSPDNCQKGVINGVTLPVSNTGQLLTLGSGCSTTTTDPACSTMGNLEGSGPFTNSTMADIMFSTHETYVDGCSYDYVAESKFTFTGMNQATIELIFTQTNIDVAKCPGAEGAVGGGTMCTSDFTATISM